MQVALEVIKRRYAQNTQIALLGNIEIINSLCT